MLVALSRSVSLSDVAQGLVGSLSCGFSSMSSACVESCNKMEMLLLRSVDAM